MGKPKKKKSSKLKTAAITGGALTGAVLGAKYLPRLLTRGRALRIVDGKVESITGKTVASAGRSVTPLDLIARKGKSLRNKLNRAKDGKLKTVVQKVDDALAMRLKHYGVGRGTEQGKQKILHATRRGLKKDGVLGSGDFKNVRIIDEGSDALRAGNKTAVEKFGKNYEKAGKNPNFNKRFCELRGGRNCESYARALQGKRAYSKQIAGLYAGAGGGAIVGGGGTAYTVRKRKK